MVKTLCWTMSNIMPTTEFLNLGEISFKVSEVKNTWPQFDLAEAFLVFGRQGDYHPFPYKAIIRTTTDPPEPIAMVSNDYVLLPNEEVKRVADSICPTYNLKLYEEDGVTKSHYSKSGNGMFLYYFPDNEHNGSAFEKEIVPGDSIKLGIHLRNSIDSTVGFGADSFSYRGLCWNGSIQQRRNAMSVYHKHTQSLKDIIPTLKTIIESALAEGEYTVLYYRQLAKTNLTPQIAEILSQTYIPQKYLPWDMKEIETTNIKGEKTIESIPDLTTLSLKSEWSRTDATHLPEENMWSVYNHITGAIWHNTKTNPQSKSLTYGALSKAMQLAIPMVR